MVDEEESEMGGLWRKEAFEITSTRMFIYVHPVASVCDEHSA